MNHSTMERASKLQQWSEPASYSGVVRAQGPAFGPGFVRKKKGKRLGNIEESKVSDWSKVPHMPDVDVGSRPNTPSARRRAARWKIRSPEGLRGPHCASPPYEPPAL